jgi:hypothetical protein
MRKPRADRLRQAADTRAPSSLLYSAAITREALHERRDDRPVVAERLCAVSYSYARFPTDELIVGALIGILEPPPSAHVVGQDQREVGLATQDIGQQAFQTFTPVELQPADACVDIGPDDVDPMGVRVTRIRLALVIDRVGLMLG